VIDRNGCNVAPDWTGLPSVPCPWIRAPHRPPPAPGVGSCWARIEGSPPLPSSPRMRYPPDPLVPWPEGGGAAIRDTTAAEGALAARVAAAEGRLAEEWPIPRVVGVVRRMGAKHPRARPVPRCWGDRPVCPNHRSSECDGRVPSVHRHGAGPCGRWTWILPSSPRCPGVRPQCSPAHMILTFFPVL